MKQNSKPQPQTSRAGVEALRSAIAKAVDEGAALDTLVLRLSRRNESNLRRDSSVAEEEISFVGGVMRFLGVRVENAPDGLSTLVHVAEERE